MFSYQVGLELKYYISIYFAIFLNGNNFCNILDAFLDTELYQNGADLCFL